MDGISIVEVNMLDWTMILETEDHKEVLAVLYSKEPLEPLAERLGVAKLSLRAKLIKEGIPLRPRGGMDPMTRRAKSRLECLDPDAFMQMTPQEIAKQFDMHVSAVYKHIKRNKLQYRRQRENLPRQGDHVQAASAEGNGDVDQRPLDTAGQRDDDVQEGDIAEDSRH